MQVGKMIEEKQVHEKQVQDMQLSLDGTHVCTASTDRTAKLVDVQTLETLKTYNTERPANSAAISPIYDHVRGLTLIPHQACNNRPRPDMILESQNADVQV